MTKCQVEVDWDLCVSPEFITRTTVTARKPHRCTECRQEIIHPGDRYERVSGKWDGEFSEYKTCPGCLEIREGLMCTHAFGEMWMDLHEFITSDDFQIGCLSRVGPAGADRIDVFLERDGIE